MSAKLVKIGSVLRFDRTRVTVDPNKEYRHLGLRSFGKGVIHYGPVPAAELSKLSYYTVPRRALLLSNIKAWEQAISVVGEECIGVLASQRFLPYVPRDESEVSLDYVFQYLLSESGTHALQKASPGSADRNRTLGRSAFEAINIPLPPLAEQERIARDIRQATTLYEADVTRAFLDSRAFSGHLINPQWKQVLVKDVAERISRPESLTPNESYSTAGVRWYGEGVFIKPALYGHEIKGRTLYRLLPGDFVYNRLFAWKGSFALVPESADPIYASNEFPAFRLNTELVLPQYMLAVFQQQRMWTAVERLSTGGTPTSRNRLKEETFLNLPFTLPNKEQQLKVVASMSKLEELRRLAWSRELLRDALPKSVRNQAFSSLV